MVERRERGARSSRTHLCALRLAILLGDGFCVDGIIRHGRGLVARGLARESASMGGPGSRAPAPTQGAPATKNSPRRPMATPIGHWGPEPISQRDAASEAGLAAPHLATGPRQRLAARLRRGEPLLRMAAFASPVGFGGLQRWSRQTRARSDLMGTRRHLASRRKSSAPQPLPLVVTVSDPSHDTWRVREAIPILRDGGLGRSCFK